MTRKATTYWDYIKVEEMLALQTGLGDSEEGLANDEVMFITIHQIDELWFKLLIRELVSVRNLFAQPRVQEQSLAAACRGIRRTALLFRQISEHFELMETMTTRDYLTFRDKLSPASGFQSAQLREAEILLGLEDSARIPLGHENSYMEALKNPDGSESAAWRRVTARKADTPTLRHAMHQWLYRTPIQGSTPDDADDADTVRRFVEAYSDAQLAAANRTAELARHEALTDKDVARLTERYQKEADGARAFLLAEDADEAVRPRVSRIRAALVFIESYRELPLLAWPREVLDGLVALEQSAVIFRQRHARMVERIIGRRTGTGGSAGVEYLDNTALRYRIFRDVWAVRSLLLPPDSLPSLENASIYGISAGQ